MGKFAEFSRVEDVIDWYQGQEIPAYAIFHDKQLRGRYIPDEEDEMDPEGLKTALEKLMNSGTYAIYTLAVYDDPKGTIKSTTPYDVSVNFQFNKNAALAGMGATSGGTYNNQNYVTLAVENALLKEENKRLREELDNPEEETDQMGSVMGFIDKISGLPGMDSVIAAIAGKIAGIITSGQQIQQPVEGPNHMGTRSNGVYEPRGLSGLGLEDSRRIDVALNQLAQTVPDLPSIMEKLSRMSLKQPLKFRIYMEALRKMQV